MGSPGASPVHLAGNRLSPSGNCNVLLCPSLLLLGVLLDGASDHKPLGMCPGDVLMENTLYANRFVAGELLVPQNQM